MKKLVALAVLSLVFATSTITAMTVYPRPAAAVSPSYPWCVQASIYRCWYMTREQCEQAVDYHGFCVTDPNVPRTAGEKVRGENAPS